MPFDLVYMPRSRVVAVASADEASELLAASHPRLSDAEIDRTAKSLAEESAILVREDATDVWRGFPGVEIRDVVTLVDGNGRALQLIPWSRRISVRDASQAESFLLGSRPDLDAAEIRAMALDVAAGFGILVIARDFEELDGSELQPGDDIIPIPPEPPPVPAPVATWFELRVVDEIGVPLAGVPAHLLVDGATVAAETDGDGRCRADSEAGATFASATLTDLDTVREQLTERWEQIRDGSALEPADDHTFKTCTASDPGAQLVKHTPHTLVFYPDVLLVRFIGAYFDKAKAFLLPNPHLREIKAIYEKNPEADLLIVGHADTEGSTPYNQALALRRAESVAAYLRDDVDAWLEFFSAGTPYEQRWGSLEEREMLNACLSDDPDAPPYDRVEYYQERRGLWVDGFIGDDTRRALVEDYMALDGVSTPAAMSVTVHSCGEDFPLSDFPEPEDDPEDDGPTVEEVSDRRVELFFFGDGLGVLPPPPGATSTALMDEYPEWRRRAHRTDEYAQLPDRPHFCFSA